MVAAATRAPQWHSAGLQDPGKSGQLVKDSSPGYGKRDYNASDAAQPDDWNHLQYSRGGLQSSRTWTVLAACVIGHGSSACCFAVQGTPQWHCVSDQGEEHSATDVVPSPPAGDVDSHLGIRGFWSVVLPQKALADQGTGTLDR